jgi:ATP-dependent protease ClpP protease subunit
MNKEIKLYGTIGRDNVTAIGVINEIDKAVSSGAKSITIRLHSDGGSVLDGNAIFNAIQQSKMHIKIIIDGIAASMASIVILAADEVEICENAFIMVHRPTGVDDGDADAHFQTSKLLKDIEHNFIQLYSKKSGLTPGEVKTKWLDGKDHWLNADEAVKYGFASRKVPAIAKGVQVTAKNVKNIYSKFAASLNIKNQSNMKKLLIDTFKLQGVTEDSTDEEVLAKLMEHIDTIKKESETNTDAGVSAMVNAALKDGKITANMVSTYKQIGKTSGLTVLSSVLATLKSPVLDLSSLIKAENKTQSVSGNKNDRTNWGLDDYRKYAPQMLRDNPKLYDELYNKEYGQD